jgi:hypothetical protein
VHPAGANDKIRGVFQYQIGEGTIIFITGFLLVHVNSFEPDEIVYNAY